MVWSRRRRGEGAKTRGKKGRDSTLQLTKLKNLLLLSTREVSQQQQRIVGPFGLLPVALNYRPVAILRKIYCQLWISFRPLVRRHCCWRYSCRKEPYTVWFSESERGSLPIHSLCEIFPISGRSFEPVNSYTHCDLLRTWLRVINNVLIWPLPKLMAMWPN